MGPLEATIHNLRQEIQNKGTESQELQRKWMQLQIELISIENENSRRGESLSTTESKLTVMKQKKRRLHAQ